MMAKEENSIRWLETLSSQDVPLVGGKNASLGKMVRELKKQGLHVPDGFATTAEAYWEFAKLVSAVRRPAIIQTSRLFW
jgi:phosphoenolpyruvate synthase/pyruvate phosphate dikinase